MDESSRATEADVYAANLEFTLKELQRKVRDHQAELEKIRSSQTETPLSPEDQAIVIKTALTNINTTSEPFLPFAGSVLPSLLALRRAHQTITESRTYLESHASEADCERKQLDSDRTNLKDQHLLTDALTSRIAALQREIAAKAEMRPEDSAREKMDELRVKTKNYDRERKQLMRALLDFIDNQLAPMLAAEELGGPVVGDIIEVDPDELAAGFNTQGKLKKPKGGEEDKRQRRIDEIWGAAAGRAGAGGGSGSGRVDGEEEIAAAGREMRELTEELSNRLVQAKGDNSASYVVLERESAAARFLVRSKVAQFHPKDANKLRLIDFGRDLEN
ncbi:centromere-associated protein K domain-containing protein [Pochonia chlamydosporia 170]|uniref:Centromere-associated protein K domain-containing protein n=1 Tax=Pochonia chlamydosporia 170 TaxID=1380566 RepID=A0A179G6A9_METCM|nr:centromere-associated protein K domain-containing protein [Pochonia chlamydosporia 170]OAQ72709.1 centromere-associated protein K domain-containing protein [Pochonia chlamydosporia 170]